MLFIFNTSKQVSFWMKDTSLALDLIFMDENQNVTQVYSQATPYSLKPIVSTYPAQFVLEIRGGRAQECGITSGVHMDIK